MLISYCNGKRITDHDLNGKTWKTRLKGRMKKYNCSTTPFERIAIDGPFPTTANNNKCILIAMDYFTKWPKAHIIPSQEVSTVAQVLVDNLVCRFGVPLELHFQIKEETFTHGRFKKFVASWVL